MKTLLTLALIAASVAAGPALAECTYPKKGDKLVVIPDGNVAQLPEMLAAARALKEFDVAIKAYGACLIDEANAFRAANPGITPEQNKELTDRLNGKLDASDKELLELADLVNTQIRVYKDKEKNAKK
ncbi:MAG: hypothetical protein ACO32H_08485 [Steroidobacteraceae bacterium]